MKKLITANIITLNEEKNIEEVIRSVQGICDEIFVVDSQSSDRTCEIAEFLGAKVVVQPYLGDGPQKAFGAPLAKNDWILSIDADERLDANAITAIEAIDLESTPYDAFSFKRKTFVGKYFIKVWYPDRVTRLYNRQRCRYNQVIGHAKVETENVLNLDADFLHFSFENYSHLIRTTEKFASRGAKMLFEKGKRASWYDPYTHGFSSLFKKLVLKGGMFQGTHGWNVSMISGFHSYLKYVLLLELQEKKIN
jgi:glycosyltransferase involved in cell wall biosynthesis